MRMTDIGLLRGIGMLVLAAGAALAGEAAQAVDAAPSALKSRSEYNGATVQEAYKPNAARPASQAATAAVGAKATDSRNARALPKDLFKMDDRAIIIVSGKPAAAGDVKREFKAELGRLSAPPATVRVTTRKATAATGAVSIADTKSAAATATLRQGSAIGAYSKSAPVVATTMNDRAAGKWKEQPAVGATVRDNPGAPIVIAGKPELSAAAARQGSSYADIASCKNMGPEILRVRGSVRSGQKFTLEGYCLGKQTGAVELIGQFPSGNLRVAFDKWTDDEIDVVMPPVRGAADHAVAITVVRFSDKARSPAKQATFHAARERLPVPVVNWNPNPSFIFIGVEEGGGNIFGGYRVWGAGTGSYTADFRVAVNATCNLDGMDASSQTGRVQQINGWENGPPNVSNVQIVWSPVCTTTTTNYLIASSSQRVCSVAFDLKAWAECPVGIAP
jgi:hypothetical protein